jgi:hypothetical protein
MLIADVNEVYASYVSPVVGQFTKIISDSFFPPVQAEEYKRTIGLDGTVEEKLLASAQPILLP